MGRIIMYLFQLADGLIYLWIKAQKNLKYIRQLNYKVNKN